MSDGSSGTSILASIPVNALVDIIGTPAAAIIFHSCFVNNVS